MKYLYSGIFKKLALFGILLMMLSYIVFNSFVHLHASLAHGLQQTATSVCLQPPQNIDLTTLDDTQLRLYGLPAHSVLDRDTQKWSHRLAYAKHRTCGSYPDPQKKTHHLISSSKQVPDVTGLYSKNWSGNVDYASRYTFGIAEAEFNVPSLFIPGSPINSHVSIWAGLGGDADFTSPTVLVQAGVDSSVTCGSCQYNESWWEVWPYNEEQNLPLSRLNSGDDIYITVTSNNSNDGQDYFYIENITANSYSSKTVTIRSYISDGATGECVLERPGIFGTNQYYALAQFNPQQSNTENISNCAVTGVKGGIVGIGNQNHDYYTMTSDGTSGGRILAKLGSITNYGYNFPTYWKGYS